MPHWSQKVSKTPPKCSQKPSKIASGQRCAKTSKKACEKLDQRCPCGRSHMHSAHACAVQTHVSVFRPGLQNQKKNDRAVTKNPPKKRENAPLTGARTYLKADPTKKEAQTEKTAQKAPKWSPRGGPNLRKLRAKSIKTVFFLDRGALGTPGPPKGRPGSTWPAKLCPKSPNGSPKSPQKLQNGLPKQYK